MSILMYVVWCLVAFALYMWYILGFNMFVNVILPWIGFIIVLMAPLVYTAYRAEKDNK